MVQKWGGLYFLTESEPMIAQNGEGRAHISIWTVHLANMPAVFDLFWKAGTMPFRARANMKSCGGFSSADLEVLNQPFTNFFCARRLLHLAAD